MYVIAIFLKEDWACKVGDYLRGLCFLFVLAVEDIVNGGLCGVQEIFYSIGELFLRIVPLEERLHRPFGDDHVGGVELSVDDGKILKDVIKIANVQFASFVFRCFECTN